MSRPLRIELKNGYYHVMNRGRDRQTIFRSQEYYLVFLRTLQEAHERFSLQTLAYCLMGNHYHLLVKTPEGNLSRAMRHLDGVYTQRHNRLKKTDGSLFRGRYKSMLIDSDAYLLHLSKYIHQNPLRAGLVDKLEDYRWSSFLSYVGGEKPPGWLHREEVYGQLNASSRLQSRYRKFMVDGDLNQDIEKFYARERWLPVLGDEDFVRECTRSMDIPDEVPKADTMSVRPSIDAIVSEVAKSFGVNEVDIYRLRKGRGSKNIPRKIAMHLAQQLGGYRLSTIAREFGLAHYGGVSFAIQGVKRDMAGDKKLERQINTIINRFDP